MWWVRRFNRIALIVLIVAVGRTATSLPDTDDSLRPPTWLIVSMPSEAAQKIGSLFAEDRAGFSWVTLVDAARQRHVFLLATTGTDPIQRGEVLDRLEAMLTPAVGPQGAIWRLDERPDLSLSTDGDDLRRTHRVARYEFPTAHMPRVERRLRKRLFDARTDRPQQPYVVLEGRDENGRTRLVILEPAGLPPDRRLTSLAISRELLFGSVRGGATSGTLMRTPGQVAQPFASDRLLDPLEPLPEVSASTTSAPAVEPGPEYHPDEAPQPLAPLPTTSRRPNPVPPLPAHPAQESGVDPVEPNLPLPLGAIDREATRRRVATAVEGWARAWSSQRVADYFAAYAREFRPAGSSIERWRMDRRDRIGSPRIIDVRIADIDVQLIGRDRVRVVFEQAYRSDHYNDRVRKQLDFVREDGTFKIARELVLQVLGKPGAQDR